MTEAMSAYAKYLKGDRNNAIANLLFGEMRGDEFECAVVESLLLGGCSSEEAERNFGIPQKAFDWYRELFFDINAFTTRLSKLSYVMQCDDDYRELRVRALDLGYEYIVNMYSGKPMPIKTQREYLTRMLMASYSKAMNMNYATAESGSAKNAKEFAKLATQVFEVLDRTSRDDDSEQVANLHILLSQVEQPEYIVNERKDDSTNKEFV